MLRIGCATGIINFVLLADAASCNGDSRLSMTSFNVSHVTQLNR